MKDLLPTQARPNVPAPQKIAFLTIRDLGGFVSDDELTFEPLARLGWQVESVPWDEPTDWSRYRAAIIRTTWDYHARLDAFLEVLGEIEASPCRLFNPIEVVRWNANKRYLDDLASRGVPVVPTEFRPAGAAVDLAAAFARFQCHDLVYKPTVGAAAFDTYRVQNVGRGGSREGAVVGGTDSEGEGAARFRGPVPLLHADPESELRIEEGLRGREHMIQPFVPEVLDPGETSIFFFDGRYSHAVLKRPREGDFRVQEEYGGAITEADPPLDLVETCRAIVELFPEPLLYARVDVVRVGESFLLMELELIEPSLYFRTVAGSAERFARALAARLADADGAGPTS